MSRKTTLIVIALSCLSAAFLPRPAAAETINFGSRSFITGDGVSSLDLSTIFSFPYAVDLGRTGGTNQTINGVTFTSDTTPGVTLGSPWSHDFSANPPTYSGHTDSAELNQVLANAHAANLVGPTYPGSVSLVVTPGTEYKLQLLYYEGNNTTNGRWSDLYVEGNQAVDNLVSSTTGSLYTYSFIALDASLDISWTAHWRRRRQHCPGPRHLGQRQRSDP